jgi:DNA-binding winged helix-turn-helix (wHTH) protein
MEICYYDYLFSISVLDMCLSPHVVQKGYIGKQVWGETHCNDQTKLDREIHELWKLINEGPRTTK